MYQPVVLPLCFSCVALLCSLFAIQPLSHQGAKRQQDLIWLCALLAIFIFLNYIHSKLSIMNYRLFMMLITASAIFSCNNSSDTKPTASKYKTIGTIDRIDSSID